MTCTSFHKVLVVRLSVESIVWLRFLTWLIITNDQIDMDNQSCKILWMKIPSGAKFIVLKMSLKCTISYIVLQKESVLDNSYSIITLFYSNDNDIFHFYGSKMTSMMSETNLHYIEPHWYQISSRFITVLYYICKI